MISCLSPASAHVAGPSLAPFFRKHCTAPRCPELMARSRGRIPFESTLSICAPRSKRSYVQGRKTHSPPQILI